MDIRFFLLPWVIADISGEYYKYDALRAKKKFNEGGFMKW